MTLRFFAIGALAGLAAVTASSAVAPARLINLHAAGRSGQCSPVCGGDSQRRATSKRDHGQDGLRARRPLAACVVWRGPQHLLADLHSLSPAARFAQLSAGGPAYVAIDATTRGDPQHWKSSLAALGLQEAAVYSNDVGGLLPISQLEAAAARAEVAWYPRRHVAGAHRRCDLSR